MCDAGFLLDEAVCTEPCDLPPSLPGLANAKTVETTRRDDDAIYRTVFFPIVAGGVSMEIELKDDAIHRDPQLAKTRDSAISSRPDLDRLWWVLRR